MMPRPLAMRVFILLVLCIKTAGFVPLSSFLSPGVPASSLCVAKEWLGGQAMMTGAVIDGMHTITNVMTMVAYSAKQKKIQVREFGPQEKILLYDYPNETLYTVTYPSMVNGTCTKSQLPGPFKEQCLPENSTITFSQTAYGAGGFTAVAWEATGTIEGTITFHVTMNSDYLPMFEELYGVKDGTPFFQNVFFFNASVVNFQPDDYVFRVPDICKNVGRVL